MQHFMRDQGAYILGEHGMRIQRLEEGHTRMRRELDLIRTWGLRLGLLALLWAAALASHLTREQSAELLAALVKAALKL